MLMRSQSFFSKVAQRVKPVSSFIPVPLTRAIHVKSESGGNRAFTIFTLENDAKSYQIQNGVVSQAYRNNGWLKFQSLLSSNLVYTFVHNSEVVKTSDTTGYTVIAGHISSFVTDANAKIIKDSIAVMRDSSYAVGDNGCVLTIEGSWLDIPTRQLIYKFNCIDVETEIKNHFLGRDLQPRYLTAINAPLDKRLAIIDKVPRTAKDFQKQEYIHFSGKAKEYLVSPEFISTAHPIAEIFDMEQIIQKVDEGSKEVGDLLKAVFGDIISERNRKTYIPNTKFFSKRAEESFYAFWKSLSEDNRRTIAINQSEPLCAEVVYYQGRALKGIEDYVSARIRFHEAVLMDESYKDKAEKEIAEIDSLMGTRPRRP